MYLKTKWFGTFLFDEQGVKEKILFPKKTSEIAKRLVKINHRDILQEEKNLVKDSTVKVDEKRLKRIGDYCPSDKIFKTYEITPEDYGYSQELLHNASLLVAKQEINKRLKAEDLQIIQMVNALDDLLLTSNLLSERLAYWREYPTP
jgi:RNA processing factor Prp31